MPFPNSPEVWFSEPITFNFPDRDFRVLEGFKVPVRRLYATRPGVPLRQFRVKELYWRHEGLDSRHAPRRSPVESKSLCDSDCGRESCSRDWGEHGHLQCCFRDALATASVRKRRSARDVAKH